MRLASLQWEEAGILALGGARATSVVLVVLHCLCFCWIKTGESGPRWIMAIVTWTRVRRAPRENGCNTRESAMWGRK